MQPPNTGAVQYVLISHGATPERELEARAKRVVPPSALRKKGRSQARHWSYLAGRAALADLFDRNGIAGWVVPDPNLGYLKVVDDHGSPLENWFVNVSHTEKLAVGVLASAPIGVDLEAVLRQVDRVMPRVATKQELQMVTEKEICPGAPGPVTLWTCKEAISKATGLGIKFGMKAFVVDFREGPPFRVAVEKSGPFTFNEPAVRSFVSEQHVITLCSEYSLLTEFKLP